MVAQLHVCLQTLQDNHVPRQLVQALFQKVGWLAGWLAGWVVGG